MVDITARVIADSVGEHSPRLLSVQTRAPKFIHQESLRHRRVYLADVLAMDPDFSFSVSSSRAIPFAKMLEEARDPRTMAKPVFWGAEQRGMSPGGGLDDVYRDIYWPDVLAELGIRDEACLLVGGTNFLTRRQAAEALWELGALMATRIAAANVRHTGVHKSIANRQVETYVHANVLMTATEPGWLNFLGLRLDGAADPVLRALAEKCWICWNESEPRPLVPGQWHAPYVDMQSVEEIGQFLATEMEPGVDPTQERVHELVLRVSAARCARLSYASFETQRRSTVAEDLALCERLFGSLPIHASPAEHQATPDRPRLWNQDILGWTEDETANLPQWRNQHQAGNLGPGWRQFRKMLPGEAVAPLPEGYERRR